MHTLNICTLCVSGYGLRYCEFLPSRPVLDVSNFGWPIFVSLFQHCCMYRTKREHQRWKHNKVRRVGFFCWCTFLSALHISMYSTYSTLIVIAGAAGCYCCLHTTHVLFFCVCGSGLHTRRSLIGQGWIMHTAFRQGTKKRPLSSSWQDTGKLESFTQ